MWRGARGETRRGEAQGRADLFSIGMYVCRLLAVEREEEIYNGNEERICICSDYYDPIG